MILTIEQQATHPFAGRNTQHKLMQCVKNKAQLTSKKSKRDIFIRQKFFFVKVLFTWTILHLQGITDPFDNFMLMSPS